MAARRLLILMLVLLVVSTLAAALVPPQAEREQEPAGPRRAGPDATRTEPEGGRLIRRALQVSPKQGAEAIEMRRGDELELTVRSDVADQVEIPAFGRLAFAGPEAPARFYLLPDRTGVFEVRALEADRVIARITVVQAERARRTR